MNVDDGVYQHGTNPAAVGPGAGAGATLGAESQQQILDLSSNPQDSVAVGVAYLLTWLECCSAGSDNQIIVLLTNLSKTHDIATATGARGLTDSHASAIARGIARVTRSGDVMAAIANVVPAHALDLPGPEGDTAAKIAVDKRCPAQLRILVSRCPAAATAGPDMPVVVYAAKLGHLECVKVLVGRSLEAMRATCKEYGETVMLKAARCGHLSIVRWSLETFAEVEVDERNRAGSSALNLAAMNGHTNVVEYLLSVCADKNASNDYGYTPVISASDNGRDACLDLLLAERAYISSRLHNKRTAYLVAAMKGRLGCLTRLLEQCAGDPGSEKKLVSAVDKDGNTAAHLAAETDQFEALQEVVRAGCPLDVVNAAGHTALDVAREHSVRGREFLSKHKEASYLVGRSDSPPTAIMPEEEAVPGDDCDSPDNVVVTSLTSPGAAVRVAWGWRGPDGVWRAYSLETSGSLETAHNKAQHMLSEMRGGRSASSSQRGGIGSVTVPLEGGYCSLGVDGHAVRLLESEVPVAELTRMEFVSFQLPAQWRRSRFTATRECVALVVELQGWAEDMLQLTIPNAEVLVVKEVRFHEQYQRYRHFTARMVADTGMLNVKHLWYGTGARPAVAAAFTAHRAVRADGQGEPPSFTWGAANSHANASDTKVVMGGSTIKAKQLILADVCLGHEFIMRGAEHRVGFTDLHGFDSQRVITGSRERYYVRNWLQFYPRWIVTYRVKGSVSPR